MASGVLTGNTKDLTEKWGQKKGELHHQRTLPFFCPHFSVKVPLEPIGARPLLENVLVVRPVVVY